MHSFFFFLIFDTGIRNDVYAYHHLGLFNSPHELITSLIFSIWLETLIWVVIMDFFCEIVGLDTWTVRHVFVSNKITRI